MKKLHISQAAIGLSMLIGASVSAKPMSAQSDVGTDAQAVKTEVAASLLLTQNAIAVAAADRAIDLNAFGKRTALASSFDTYSCPEALKLLD